MTFGESIKTCYSKYATFNGRATRSELWWYILFYTLVSAAIAIVEGAQSPGTFRALWGVINLLPVLAVGVRRVHDLGKNGWFSIIPIYNLVLFATEGQQGRNEYGDDPLHPAQDFDFDRQNLNA